MTVILVRHGQSEGNAAGIIQGWLDTPLTEEGRSQADLAGQTLKNVDVKAVYASPLSRAFDTGQAIASHHGLDLITDPDLREQRWGEAEGLTWQEARERWGLDPGKDWGVMIPAMEATSDLRLRAYKSFERIANAHPKEIAVCATHGGVVIQILAAIFGLSDSEWPRAKVLNAGITTIEGTDGNYKVSNLNTGSVLATT